MTAIRTAFTLIEVLAALVLLGLLALAVVPLQRTLLDRHARTDRGAAAQAALAVALADPALQLAAGDRPVAGHGDWVLRLEPLLAQPGAALVVGRAWWRLSIRERGVAAPLAQVLSVWPSAPPAAP